MPLAEMYFFCYLSGRCREREDRGLVEYSYLRAPENASSCRSSRRRTLGEVSLLFYFEGELRLGAFPAKCAAISIRVSKVFESNVPIDVKFVPAHIRRGGIHYTTYNSLEER